MKLSYIWVPSSAAIVLLSMLGLVAEASADGDRPAPPPIPKEAVAACTGLAEGDACTVTFGPNAIEGTCAKTPDGILACRPNHPPPGPPPQPR
jgi:hypothetical protein